MNQSIYDESVSQAAEVLRDEIDAEVLRGMLVEIGWHQVILNWIMTHEVSQEVDMWVAINIKGRHWNRGLVWIFENEQDATWFTLRWSS